MSKMLYILNFARRLNQFSHASMLAAKNLGIDFHIISNWGYDSADEMEADARRYGITIYQVDFMRNPLHPGNFKAYGQICDIMKREKFDIVHTNTPIGGVLGRLAARRFHTPNVIYQAHGFHFYQGGPKSGWVLYYPIEKILASATDLIITINQEDFRFASHKLHPRRQGGVIYVPGIGIDYEAYSGVSSDREHKKLELGIPVQAAMILSVGELNQNKHHEIIIRAMEHIRDAHYVIAGQGELLNKLMELAAKFSVSDRVHFLGFRDDVKQLYKTADIFCLPSYREGLSASVMEAMASGLPVVCSDIRGNRDLVVHEKGGYLVGVDNTQGYTDVLNPLAQSSVIRDKMGAFNSRFIEQFSLDRVTREMEIIYTDKLQAGESGGKNAKQHNFYTEQ